MMMGEEVVVVWLSDQVQDARVQLGRLSSKPAAKRPASRIGRGACTAGRHKEGLWSLFLWGKQCLKLPLLTPYS